MIVKKIIIGFLILVAIAPVIINFFIVDRSILSFIRNCGISLVYLLLGVLVFAIVLGFQLINPFCSSNTLKIVCNGFLITMFMLGIPLSQEW